MNCKKYGFTLSEVLITLVIIGVIAAITLPAVTANYRRQEASARIKKIYSMLQNASTRAKSDGKNWEYWAENANSSGGAAALGTITEFADYYLLPYLSYYKTEKKETRIYVYLNDGSYFSIYKGSCIDFISDINGNKKPNTEGRDIFRFLFCPYSINGFINSGLVIPYQLKTTTTREKALSQCKSSALYCSALLMFDNWEFKKDYPYSI